MQAKVYKQDGSQGSAVTLPETVFGVAFKPDLVHQVVVAMQANERAGTAHTKDRSEVAGTGKKPWRQKGTGRARHGSRRSPIWAGGGVTFGPRNEKDHSKRTTKKMRARALASVLSRKYNDGELVVVEKLAFDAPRTAAAKAMIAALASATDQADLAGKKRNAALIVLGERDEHTEKSFRNFGNIGVVQAKDVNPLDLLTFKYVIVSDPATVLEILEARVRTHNS